MTPVEGYKPLTEDRVSVVNVNKRLEEQVLQRIDELRKDPNIDPRMLSIGFTEIQSAFMWINRAVFKPERIKLE